MKHPLKFNTLLNPGSDPDVGVLRGEWSHVYNQVSRSNRFFSYPRGQTNIQTIKPKFTTHVLPSESEGSNGHPIKIRSKLHSELLLFLIFSHFYVGSMCLMRRLHLARACGSSLDKSFSDKSFPMVSIHLRFGLPLLLFPGTSITIALLPTYSSSLLITCPYNFNLLSCTSWIFLPPSLSL